ncbi:globin domain-containing protein [Streptodolium elevatio]|uniref:nitric oxide dioxygenase n=1 Tax=Streptodolium elevatio TaxID=3157996 RepID=A0ABV3DSE3_9ACTN
MTLDPRVLRHSFAIVERRADRMAKYFYARLFREHPGVRSLFPDDMADQRDRLFGALTAAVAHVDDPDVLVPFLRGLGADHRRFGAVAAHYPAVGQSLVATIRFFSGDAWSAEVEAAWKAAYDVLASVMVEAARQAEAAGEPAVWDAKVLRRERPAPTVATFTLQVEPDYPFRAGQYLSLTLHEAEVRNVWRQFSIANAPRPDNTVDLHVRRIPGGAVSNLLLDRVTVGDRLRLGMPMGTTTLVEGSGRPLLFVAGGTGWGAVKALVMTTRCAAPTGTPHCCSRRAAATTSTTRRPSSSCCTAARALKRGRSCRRGTVPATNCRSRCGGTSRGRRRRRTLPGRPGWSGSRARGSAASAGSRRSASGTTRSPRRSARPAR